MSDSTKSATRAVSAGVDRRSRCERAILVTLHLTAATGLIACSRGDVDRSDTRPTTPRESARLDDTARGKGDFLADEQRLLRSLDAAERAWGSADERVTTALGALSRFYERHGRWDEYGMTRSRMLDAWKQSESGKTWVGPPPGGPWVRPGAGGYDSERQTPPSFISRWMNRRVLPELYGDAPITESALQKRLEARAGDAATRGDRLAEASAEDALASLFAAYAQFARARAHARRALDLRRGVLPADHVDVARSERALASIPDFDRAGGSE